MNTLHKLKNIQQDNACKDAQHKGHYNDDGYDNDDYNCDYEYFTLVVLSAPSKD